MKIVILGASRGLGKCLYQELQNLNPGAEFLLVSRKIDLSIHGAFRADCTQETEALFERIESFTATHIIMCAGGGVHGVYESKPWHSHEWTLKLNLIFPMKLAYFCLNRLTQLEQLIFVGSSVAESAPDPLASSYCASKHGLLGFVTTLIKENKGLDIRLVSPPYMETALLPEGSWPRREGLAQKPEEVARKFVQHMMDKSRKNTHITF